MPNLHIGSVNKKGNGPYLHALIEGDYGIIRWLDVVEGPLVPPIHVDQSSATFLAPLMLIESASHSGLIAYKDGSRVFTTLVENDRFKVVGDETVMSLAPTKPIVTGSRDGNLALTNLLVELDDREIIVNNTTPGAGGGPVGNLGLHIGRSLAGAINGVNVVFTVTADKFIHGSTVSEAFYVNGLRQHHGASNDYVASESVPAGGYDTITMVYPPKPGDTLLIDYYEDP